MRSLAITSTIILGALALTSGCESEADRAPPGVIAPTHAHVAPHGGALIVLGEHFAMIELVLEPTSGTLTAYILDGEAERALIPEESTLKLRLATDDGGAALELKGLASSLTGETADSTSRFAGAHPALKGRASFRGKLSKVTLRGQVFQNVALPYPEGSDPSQ